MPIKPKIMPSTLLTFTKRTENVDTFDKIVCL